MNNLEEMSVNDLHKLKRKIEETIAAKKLNKGLDSIDLESLQEEFYRLEQGPLPFKVNVSVSVPVSIVFDFVNGPDIMVDYDGEVDLEDLYKFALNSKETKEAMVKFKKEVKEFKTKVNKLA